MNQFLYGQEFFLAVMADTSGAIGKVGAESWLERGRKLIRRGTKGWEVPPGKAVCNPSLGLSFPEK